MKTIFRASSAWFIVGAINLAGAVAWGQTQPPPPPILPVAPPPPPAAIQGAPKIQFDKTVYDFGKTSSVHQVAGTFMIKNAGAGVLKLQKPAASCGCTVPNLKKDSLQPGEETALDFTLNVGPYKATLQKTITVTCNDPQTPTTVLTLKVDYAPVFEIVPAMLYVDNVRLGTATNLYAQAKRTDGKKLKVSKVLSNDPWIKVNYEPAPDEASGRFVVQIKPEGPARRFYENVRVFGDTETEALGSFYVSGRALGDISIVPEQVNWFLTSTVLTNFQAATTNVAISNQLTRRILINSTVPGQAVTITNITSSIPSIKTRVLTRGANAGYELVARLTEPPATNLTGNITFETGVASQPKVTVPIGVHVWRR